MHNISRRPLFICVGELSGDVYASVFVDWLKKKKPDLKIYGVGAKEIEKKGVDLVEDCRKLMTFGFSVGIFSLLQNYQMYRTIGREIYRIRPETFVAVAYPGINLLLCKYAKKLGCQTIYFLPPQIWAWGTFRKYFIKKWVDKVVSVFPFEYEFYKKCDIDTVYFKNPFFEKLKKYERDNYRKRIGFMPGSRMSEIKRNLPVMIELMRKISQEKAGLEFNVILHPLQLMADNEWLIETFRSLGNSFENKLKIIAKKRYQAMKNCDVIITSSGTASFEAAIMGVSQIFFNRPSFFDFYIFKRFLHIKEYNMANLYFNKKIVPSFVLRNTDYILQNLFGLINNCIS